MTDDAPRTPGHDREPDPDRTGEDADARADPGAGASDSPHLGERLTQQIAAQWALIRAEREAERDAEREAERRRTDIGAGRSNFSRAQVPHALDLAAAWSWRFLVIVAASFLIAWTLARFSVVTLPLAIALLLAALVSPLVNRLNRAGLRRGLSAIAGVLVILGVVAALLTFAGQQVVNGSSDLADQVVTGLDRIRVWLTDGPLNASQSQIDDYIKQVQDAIANWSKSGALEQVSAVGTTIGHVTAGFFIVLFASYFFLADGDRIWAWAVRLAPRAARTHVDSSGRVAWISLTQFVRATVMVALVDAIGVMAVALFLGIPFVLAIGVLVFLGAFVPLIGATVAGGVAVLVALVDQGPVSALIMLVGVIVVQQIEGHILQPFLMGRFVSIHPLGIIVAIGIGLLVAGVAGALLAVPLVAAVNAVVMHLNQNLIVREGTRTEVEEELRAEGG